MTLALGSLLASCGSKTAPSMCSDDPWMKCESNAAMIPQYSQIDRSIVIDNHLVSLGMGGLEIHALDKLARRQARILWPLTTDPQSRVVSVD